MSQRSKFILFTLGILVIAETYLFGFSNTNDNLFSGTHSNAFVVAGVVLILALALVLFIQHFKLQKPAKRNIKSEDQLLNAPEELQSNIESEVVMTENAISQVPDAKNIDTKNEISDLSVSKMADNALEIETLNPFSETEKQNPSDNIQQLLNKAKTILNNFTIEVWGRDGKEDFTGLEAAAIHLNRIAILYNDPKQFRNRFTGYDRRLIEVLELYQQAVQNYNQLAEYDTSDSNSLYESLTSFYRQNMQELTTCYRSMINRLYQKNAIDMFAPVLQLIHKIQKETSIIETNRQPV